MAVMPIIPALPAHYVASIPVRRWLDFTEASAMETRLGFKVFQHGDNRGSYLVVAPQNEPSARAYLASAGLTAP